MSHRNCSSVVVLGFFPEYKPFVLLRLQSPILWELLIEIYSPSLSVLREILREYTPVSHSSVGRASAWSVGGGVLGSHPNEDILIFLSSHVWLFTIVSPWYVTSYYSVLKTFCGHWELTVEIRIGINLLLQF